MIARKRATLRIYCARQYQERNLEAAFNRRRAAELAGDDAGWADAHAAVLRLRALGSRLAAEEVAASVRQTTGRRSTLDTATGRVI